MRDKRKYGGSIELESILIDKYSAGTIDAFKIYPNPVNNVLQIDIGNMQNFSGQGLAQCTWAFAERNGHPFGAATVSASRLQLAAGYVFFRDQQ